MLCIEEKSHEKNEMEAAGGICAGSPVVCGSGTCHSAGAGVRIGGIGILRMRRTVSMVMLFHLRLQEN